MSRLEGRARQASSIIGGTIIIFAAFLSILAYFGISSSSWSHVFNVTFSTKTPWVVNVTSTELNISYSEAWPFSGYLGPSEQKVKCQVGSKPNSTFSCSFTLNDSEWYQYKQRNVSNFSIEPRNFSLKVISSDQNGLISPGEIVPLTKGDAVQFTLSGYTTNAPYTGPIYITVHAS